MTNVQRIFQKEILPNDNQTRLGIKSYSFIQIFFEIYENFFFRFEGTYRGVNR